MNTRWVVLLLLSTISFGEPARAQTVDRRRVVEGEAASTTSKTEPLIEQSKYARWRNALPDDYPQVADYRRVFLRWVAGAEEFWGPDPERPELGACRFGERRHTHVRTARSLPVYAALAADPELDEPAGTRRKLGERLNAAIAFLCATYDPNGPRERYWGKKPSRNSLRYETWVIGNMLDVVQITPELVTPENKQRIREILVDIVEDERTSGRAEALGDYRHEGITWTINLLARGAVLYPDHPQASRWLDLAHRKVFHSPYSKFVSVRDPQRFASWGWQARRDRSTGKHRSTGRILPSGHGFGDHLAQWDDNLVPDYWTVDERGRRSYLQIGSKTNRVEVFSGGFAVSERAELFQAADEPAPEARGSVIDHRVMVALPDGRTVIFAASDTASL
jgi:hypothetical protein